MQQVIILRAFISQAWHAVPLKQWIAACLCLVLVLSVQAQTEPFSLRADTISVIATDTAGRTVLQGAEGSVPGRADVFAQNLFTGEAVTVKANSAGAFTLEIGGTEITPYGLNAVLAATEDQRDNPASLPGDTGLILWSHLPPSADGRASFAAGGLLSHGATPWWGEGDVSPRLAAGETLSMRLDVGLATDNKDTSLTLRVRGHLSLERIADDQGRPVAGQSDLVSGWSGRMTRAGLPVLSAESPIELGFSDTAQLIRTGDTLTTTLNFSLPLPADLPAGLYVPRFRGDIQVGDSAWSDWYANRVLSVAGTGTEIDSATRLPVVLHIASSAAPQMLWTLFQADSSDGASGLLPVGTDDLNVINQRRYPPVTYILPPGRYPLEPYIPNLLANNESAVGLPRVPLSLPGGEYSATITLPNASIDRIAAQPFRQIAFDTRLNQPPMARLTTLDPLVTEYPFTMYGIYDVTLNGSIFDAAGQQYAGGGAYRVLIAEPMDLTPATPLGMPFQEGNVFHAGVHLAPSLPAEVTVTLHYFPLGQDNPILFSTAGQANASGTFIPTESFVFEGAGEYIVDYEARYTDAQGRLWAASVRSAGVVSSLDSALVAHGRRGLVGYDRTPLAWFDTSVYPVDAPALVPLPYWPYHSGDLVRLPNRPEVGFASQMSVQDTQGSYVEGLQEQTDLSPDALLALSRVDALPTLYDSGSYAYLSAVTPSVTLRQFVQSQSDASLLWSMTDPLTDQIGGAALKPGDLVMLYGGVVTPDDTAGYAAVGLITDEDSNLEVVPPFTRPLATDDDDTPVWLDVWPLSMTAGQQIPIGETFSLSGQVIPPLPAAVTVRLTSPNGNIRSIETTANAAGYFYDPQSDFVITEGGVWQVEIETQFAGRTSAGQVEQTHTGQRQFSLYVPTDSGLITTDPLEATLQTPGQAVQINFVVPPDWTEVQAFYTARTDTAVLDSGELLVQTGAARYVYARLELANDSPMIERDFSGDVIYLSFLFTGLDATGQPAARSRTYTVINGVVRANPE